MRATMTISLPEEIKKELESWTKKKDLNKSYVIQEALKQYLFQEELREIRRKAVPKARARGIYTDEDVFRIVS